MLYDRPKPESSRQRSVCWQQALPLQHRMSLYHMVSITSELWPESPRSVHRGSRSGSSSQISNECSFWTLASLVTFLLTWNDFVARIRLKLVSGTSLRGAKIFSLWLWSGFQVLLLSVQSFPNIEIHSIALCKFCF